MTIKLLRTITSLILLTSFMAACSMHRPLVSDTSSREALEERIHLLWKARVAKDRQTVYMLADAQFQKTTDEAAYAKKKGLTILEYEIGKISLSDDGKEAHVVINFKTIMMGVAITPTVTEKWIFEEGLWRVKLSGRKSPFHKE